MRSVRGTVVNKIEDIPVGVFDQDSKYWPYAMKQTSIKGYILNVPEGEDPLSLRDLSPMGIRTLDPPLNIYDLELMWSKVGGVENCFSKFQRLGHIFVNGQVKNYLSALLAICVYPQAEKIAILGSRAGEGSGHWIEMFADAMITRGRDIVINCYDPLETGSQKRFSFNDQSVTINRYARKYESSGSEFDLIVDDIYTSGGTESIISKWGSKHWVRKCNRSESAKLQWSMFFHPTEGREVSSSFFLRTNQVTSCQCAICRLCATVSYDIKSSSVDVHAFWKFRAYASALGAYVCDRSSFMADMLVISSTVVTISTGQLCIPQSRAEHRAADTVARYLETVKIGTAYRSNRDNAVISVKQSYKKAFKKTLILPLVTDSGVNSNTDNIPYFSGKSVFFAGVSPTVLGITPIKPRTGSTYSTGGDIIIASGLSALSLVNGPGPEIWMPSGISLPGYTESVSFRFKNFSRYDCDELPFRPAPEVDPPVRPLQLGSKVDYSSRFNVRNKLFCDDSSVVDRASGVLLDHFKRPLLPKAFTGTASSFLEAKGSSVDEMREFVLSVGLPMDPSSDRGEATRLPRLFWIGHRIGLWVVDRGRFVITDPS